MEIEPFGYSAIFIKEQCVSAWLDRQGIVVVEKLARFQHFLRVAHGLNSEVKMFCGKSGLLVDVAAIKSAELFRILQHEIVVGFVIIPLKKKELVFN